MNDVCSVMPRRESCDWLTGTILCYATIFVIYYDMIWYEIMLCYRYCMMYELPYATRGKLC